VNLDLANGLRSRAISHVYVVGLAGDYCVKDTALGSAKAGFTTYVIEEGQRCVDPGTWDDVKSALAQGSVSVVGLESDEVKRVLTS
jgi:nicotinamidase-related amidase